MSVGTKVAPVEIPAPCKVHGAVGVRADEFGAWVICEHCMAAGAKAGPNSQEWEDVACGSGPTAADAVAEWNEVTR